MRRCVGSRERSHAVVSCGNANFDWPRTAAIAAAGLALLACSGGRKHTRDDAAAKTHEGSDATVHDSNPSDTTTPGKSSNPAGDATLARSGTVHVVVRWPSPPPAAFVAAPTCLDAGEVAATLTTMRLVVGALVQIDGTATTVGESPAPVLFVISDCAVRPAVAIAARNVSVQLRSNGSANLVTLQHGEMEADRRRVQFPIIGHTVEVPGLASGIYHVAVANAAVAAGTLLVTDHAAAVSNGDGRVQFTAAPGPHRITADLPALGPRPAMHAEVIVQVVAGEELTADLNFGAP